MLKILKRLALIVVGPALLLFICAAPYICENRKGFRGWYWRLVPRACGWLLWFLSIRVDISAEAIERLASDTNSLFAVNHRSHLDGFALLSNVPSSKWVTFGAKKELFDNFLIGRGFRAAGLVEIDRSSGKQALDVLTSAVADMPARKSLILFPEGTRSRTAGLAKFKAGAAIVARNTGRNIRPVVISNSDTLLPRGAIIPMAGTICVDVLEEFTCDPAKSVDEDTCRLHEAMSVVFDAATARSH